MAQHPSPTDCLIHFSLLNQLLCQRVSGTIWAEKGQYFYTLLLANHLIPNLLGSVSTLSIEVGLYQLSIAV